MNWLQKISQSQVYYHGSNRELPIGTILRPQPQGYTKSYDSMREEKVIEQYRPPNKISRQEAVFLVDNPDDIDNAGGNNDYIYIVEPIGPVERSDMSWYGLISTDPTLSKQKQKILAANYWNGIQNTINVDLFASLWEYRCKQAKIIKELDDFSTDFRE